MAISSKVVAILTPIFCFLFVGCNAFDHPRATIEHVCPVGGGNYISLELYEKTRELASGHSDLDFIEGAYDFTLLKKPEAHAVFAITDVILTRTQSRTKHISDLGSGQVVVDLKTRTLSVSLMTRHGPFPGNGEYTLHYIE
jgi:hypothetical protein